MIAASALFIWRGLGVLTNCDSPIVVVLSGSMEPAYYRGDLLLLTHYDTPIKVGDVVVYELKDQAIPIVHRAIQVNLPQPHPPRDSPCPALPRLRPMRSGRRSTPDSGTRSSISFCRWETGPYATSRPTSTS